MMTFILLLAVLGPLGLVIFAVWSGLYRKQRVAARGNSADSGYDTSSSGSFFPTDYSVLAESHGNASASDSSSNVGPSCDSGERSSDGGSGSCDSGGDSGGGSSDSGGGGGD